MFKQFEHVARRNDVFPNLSRFELPNRCATSISVALLMSEDPTRDEINPEFQDYTCALMKKSGHLAVTLMV